MPLTRSTVLRRARPVLLACALFQLSTLPSAADSSRTGSDEIRSAIAAARGLQAEGAFKEAFGLLVARVSSDMGASDRDALSSAFTELGIAEYKQRNYGNSAEAVREALGLLPTNRTATELFLTLKREKLIRPETGSALEALVPAESAESPPVSYADQGELISSLKRTENLQKGLMEKLDASVAELARAIEDSDRPASAANREFRASLGDIARRQSELLEQTKLVAAEDEDRNRAIAELARSFRERPAFPSWLPPVLVALACVLALSLAMHAYQLFLTMKRSRRAVASPTADARLPLPPLPAPPDEGQAIAVLRGGLLSAAPSPREEIIRYLEAVADLDRPINRDARAMQWALLVHDRLDAALEGNDMSPLVARLGKLVAKRLGLPRLECEAIYRYSLIHDLGYLLLDQERLASACAARDISADDLAFIRSHVGAGVSFLEGLGTRIPPSLFIAAASHHERMDGSGYPAGLSGSQVPLIARIIGVCETYLALQTPRRYRAALDPPKALDVIARLEAEKFDPEIVGALTSLAVKED